MKTIKICFKSSIYSLFGTVIAVFAILVTTVSAKTVYVDDTLYLGLYEDRNGRGEQFSSVPSGTRLKVLKEHTNYSLVRTKRGTEGLGKK